MTLQRLSEYEWNQDVEVTLLDDNFWTFKNTQYLISSNSKAR